MALLNDKVVVITGGTRGFGMAMALAFSQEGAKVVLGSRSLESVNQAVSTLQSSGAVASGKACDIAQQDQVQALADHALETFGQFDVWVNNAALSAPYGPTFAIDPETYLTVMRTNIMGTYFGSLAAMRHFLSLGKGKLINILGVGDRKPAPMQNAYGASKAWMLNFTLALAEENQQSGVDVFAFQPGMMDTDLLKKVEVIEGFESRLDRLETVMQVLSHPAEVPARKVVWLASEETDGRNGLVVRELTPWKMLRGAIREGLKSILRLPKRRFDIQITSVPAAFKVEKGV